MVSITVECANPNPHAPHSWREGFLWHRKRVCGGVPEWFNEFRIPEHRHHYKFLEGNQSDEILMVWRCDVPGCNKIYTRFRSLFNYQTRVRRTLADGYSVAYKKQRI